MKRFVENRHQIGLTQVFLNRNKEAKKSQQLQSCLLNSLSLATSRSITCFQDPGDCLFSLSKVNTPLQMLQHSEKEFVFFNDVTMHRKICCTARKKKPFNVIFTSHPSSGHLEKGSNPCSTEQTGNKTDYYQDILTIIFIMNNINEFIK